MATVDLTIKQGKTFSRTWRWGTSPLIYKAITGATQGAPMTLTVAGHGLPDGWPVSIVSMRGMTEANAKHSPPWPIDFVRATVVDVNTLSFNDVDSSDFTAYTAGGYVRTYTPVDLSNYTARMKIKDRIGGNVLASFTSDAGDITLDNTNKKVTLTINATITAGYAWSRGVYDLELENLMIPYTKELSSGNIVVVREVTT